MDINDNQQINTFLKGMNTDTSDALLDSSQYRYAENLRLVTNTDSNEGELRIVDGTGWPLGSPSGTILALTSVRDMLIAITKTTYTEYEQELPGISIYTNRDKGNGEWFCVVDNVPYDEFVQEGETEPHFSLVTRWESDSNVKLYIAEGVKAIISLNVTKSYPHIGRSHNTIEDIAPYSSSVLLAPTLAISTGGSLKSAKVQYAYRLYNIGQPASQLSPLSRVVSLYKGYNQGYASEKITNRSVNITIPQLTTDAFKKILIFRINYVILGQEPTVNLIYDGDIITSITDIGQSVEQYGAAEFLGLTQAIIIPKIIESKEDYLFAGNVKYTQDDYDKELEDAGLNFRAYSSGDFDNGWSSDYNSAREFNKQYDTPNTDYNFDNWKRPYSTADSTTWGGGIGPIVSWFYTSKQYYVDKDNTFYTTSMNKTAGPVVSLRRGEVYRYGIIIYNDKGVKSSVNWIADIMVPDKKFDDYDGEFKSSYVYGGGGAFPTYDYDHNKWLVSVIGIEFEVDCTQIPNCSGFEIVRCVKSVTDSKVITQGIVGITSNVLRCTRWDDTTPVYSNTHYLMPQGFISSQYILNGDDISPNRQYLQFASPEYIYQQDDVLDLISMYDKQSYLQTVKSYYMPTTIDGYHMLYTLGTASAVDWDNFVVLRNVDSLNITNDNSLRLLYRALGSAATVVYRGIYGFGSILRECWKHDASMTPSNINSRGNKCWDVSVTNVAALNDLSHNNQKLYIESTSYPNVPSPEHYFSSEKVATFRDDITPIEGAQYVEWMAHGLFSRNQYNVADEDIYNRYTQYESVDDLPAGATGGRSDYYLSGYLHPVGIPGVSFLIKTNEDLGDYADDSKYVPITVANICKNTVPYGGPLTYKTGTVDYIHQGAYVKVDGLHRDSVIIYDGDCYPGIFEYTSLHVYDNSIFKWSNRAMINYYVPIESNIDLRATYGDLYSRSTSSQAYYTQPLAGGMDGFSQMLNEYLYNTAYNANPNILTSSQTIYEDIDTNNFDVRIHNSQRKTNNEHIDKWTEFKATDYIDVDSRFGQLTNMRLFKDKLLFWQENASGILSVNERTLVNDLENNNLVLGVGGILDRYDYISTVYGMRRNQYEAEIQSNTHQYWWDDRRKEILQYASGLLAIPLTRTKLVRNYINDNNKNSHPVMIYNNKYDEIICNVENKESLIYNEKVQQFISIYKMNPQFRAVINGTTIITDSSDLYHMDILRDDITLLGRDVYPKLKYVVNRLNVYNKTFDITTFGGRFYGGGSMENGGPDQLTFTFDTPLKQHSTGTGRDLITNREYDFRLDIPRNNGDEYGGRMRGKSMQCELKSSSNSGDFSLQYILTKYRMSWS